ncbi:uncharacterized protein VP01_669g5 [Puccinia sorghi]|uniref:Retrotransposon gag domain-containing protein n=1 Tax=Puccinia sorghi TaxID=27349 RepID=A0A0L6UEU2_9BASI|nr:uncharacterized protein VP01_669g5 [Puccinia sorghi]
MLAKEQAQQLATEENLCQTQAHLDAAVGQQNQNPTPPQIAPAPPPTSSSNYMVLAKHQHFNGALGAPAKSFVGQILLHTITYPNQFPTDSSKVAFAISFMTEYAETWSQPYLMKVLNAEEVAFNKFLDDFKSSFFDHNCQHRAEVALQSLRQNGTVSAYMQEFNSHACTVGWTDTPLMSLYQHGLKENVQLAVQDRQLKASRMADTPPSPPLAAPTTDPNAMDLLAFQRGPNNGLSGAKQALQVQLKLCFRCGQAGNVSCGCSNGSRQSQAEINRIRANPSTTF